MRKPLRRLLLWSLGGLAALLMAAAAAAWITLSASLPQTDGKIVASALGASAELQRDDWGVATIRGQNRLDVAYVLGFAHAQDRFFQMDLLRRSAAGELAELFGPQALTMDRERRLHRFRARAQAALETASQEDRALLTRYAAGVNDGLARLRARPFEYLLLGVAPRPWEPVDSLLVVWAMYFDLQDDQERRAVALRWLRENSSAQQLAFLVPDSSSYDAPLDAPSIDAPPPALPAGAPEWLGSHADGQLAALDEAPLVGSNNWAVSGERSARGTAIVANDMHLGLRLPNVWYRSVLSFDVAPGKARRVGGVTLPGAPVVVAGSNGSIAWGFTNSYGRYLEHVALQADPADRLRFKTPAGWERAREYPERIDVRGAPSESLTVRETSLGPVKEIGQRLFADHWVAHRMDAVNLGLARMEQVDDVASALALANHLGIPAQNFVVGDRSGHIGWTIAGPLPKQLAASAGGGGSSPGMLIGDELLEAERYPRIVDPAGGQIWTANNRQLAGAGYALLGDGGADMGARAQQIRDGLKGLTAPAQEADVFAVSLDDRALFMSAWRDRALRVLDADATQGHAERAEFARILSSQWNGRASADSAAYSLAREFFEGVYRELFAGVDARMQAIYPGTRFFNASRRWPATAARLLDEAPDRWLPDHRSWRQVQLAAIDDAIAKLEKDGHKLSEAAWGERNRTNIAHPFVQAMSFLAPVLSAPSEPQAGDRYMPRVAGANFGQSERFAVAPGNEERGLFCMPGGQSGHPLSPYFLAGHEAWLSGKPLPFLGGEARHTLTFAAR